MPYTWVTGAHRWFHLVQPDARELKRLCRGYGVVENLLKTGGVVPAMLLAHAMLVRLEMTRHLCPPFAMSGSPHLAEQKQQDSRDSVGLDMMAEKMVVMSIQMLQRKKKMGVVLMLLVVV
mmetsp:Transcript_46817/g.92134  ORF Transcript_46817/g.92134 Transcript_46817/m.92134 type:complete len:120 (-) Transcript_46817:433-792(-)